MLTTFSALTLAWCMVEGKHKNEESAGSKSWPEHQRLLLIRLDLAWQPPEASELMVSVVQPPTAGISQYHVGYVSSRVLSRWHITVSCMNLHGS